LAFAAALLALLSASVPPAAGQSRIASPGGSEAQYVFVLDDSRSMQQTDSERLSVFAVRSLISMLDDRDEVSVVRLNGRRDGEPSPPIEPLSRNRARIQPKLDLNGGLARYGADNTPCASGLAEVRALLEGAHRPGVSQVVIFLTDGECTPAASEQPDVQGFLGGLRSQQEKLFQFYLLRFYGQRTSPGLERLAQATGGQVAEVSAGDPTRILATFARVLSRSQGYESYLLTPAEPGLAAHRGAERVRLLAVAKGAGEPLRFRVQGRNGASPPSLGQPRTGQHRYGQGDVYRFAALDYRPQQEPVTVGVEGAGNAWKVVALPEYRLAVRMSLRPGECEAPGGGTVGSSVDVGSTICALAELVNAAGQPVSRDVTPGDLEARLEIRQSGGTSVDVALNPLSNEQARFGATRSHLEKGDYEFQPVVRLPLGSGDKATLRGTPSSLQVASINIAAEPAQLDFGTLRPGMKAPRQIRWTGNFPPAKAHLELRDRAEIPACVTVELSGAAEGKALAVEPGSQHWLTARAAPYCGPQSIGRDLSTSVLLVFDESGRRVEVPVRLALDYRIEVPDSLSTRVRAGESADLDLNIRGNFEGGVKLRAAFDGPDQAESWPEERDDLELGFAAERRGRLREAKGGPLAAEDFQVGPGAAPLRLRAVPSRCCGSGEYRTALALTPAAGQKTPPGARPLEPVRIPVRVRVEPAGAWACYGPRVLGGLAILLLLLLIAYLINMVRHSSFLHPETLATRLKPLVWTEFGDTVEQKSSKAEVLRRVRQELTPWKRALAWIQANPFAFGLPGGAYRETVELFLQPSRDLNRSQLVLQPVRGLQERIAKEPEAYAGRLFATATGGGVTFLAVPDSSARVSRLVWTDAAERETERPKAVRLLKARLLRYLDALDLPQENEPAGWQVG
jgi:Mg-chelatase subunit ChlD